MKLLLLPGDGIGPEIADAVEHVLDGLERVHPIGIEIERALIGLESLRTDGTTLSEATFGRASAADGVILGPVSTADYPPPAQGGLNPSAEFRRRLDLYANIRPSRTRPGVRSLAASMDLVIVRENTEGFYADRTMHLGPGEFMPTPDLAIAMRKITRQGSERIGRAAAAVAAGRRGRLTIVTKSNVLKVSDGLFRTAVQAAARDQAGLEIDEVLVDAMASLLVREPERFDVIVTTNMFGDILSNLAAELAGGLGVAGSLNAGDHCAIAQASHGSAPSLAGRHVANPAALVLSAAMLLGWLGRRDGSEAVIDAAVRLEAAVDAALGSAAGKTPDLGGAATTAEAAEAIVAALGRRA